MRAVAPGSFFVLEKSRNILPPSHILIIGVNIAGILNLVLAALKMIVGSLQVRTHPPKNDSHVWRKHDLLCTVLARSVWRCGAGVLRDGTRGLTTRLQRRVRSSWFLPQARQGLSSFGFTHDNSRSPHRGVAVFKRVISGLEASLVNHDNVVERECIRIDLKQPSHRIDRVLRH